MKTPLQTLAEEVDRLHDEQQLLAAGYKSFKAGPLKPNAETLWQKRLRPGLYVNIYTYGNCIPHYRRASQLVFQPETQLRTTGKCVNLTMLPGFESIADIETFFESAATWFESAYGRLRG